MRAFACKEEGGGQQQQQQQQASLTAKARSCIIPPIPPSASAAPAPSSPWPAIRSCMLPLGSISMALRFSKPSIRRASLPNFWLKASDRLCAGSVEMSRTLRRTLASWMASEHEVVVLPTPPLPPTKIQRRVRWSRIDWRVGAMLSMSSVLMSAADMFAQYWGGGEARWIIVWKGTAADAHQETYRRYGEEVCAAVGVEKQGWRVERAAVPMARCGTQSNREVETSCTTQAAPWRRHGSLALQRDGGAGLLPLSAPMPSGPWVGPQSVQFSYHST